MYLVPVPAPTGTLVRNTHGQTPYSCSGEEILSNRGKTFSLRRSSGSNFLSASRKGDLYMTFSYTHLFQQRINRAGKQIMSIANTRNIVIHLAVDTDPHC